MARNIRSARRFRRCSENFPTGIPSLRIVNPATMIEGTKITTFKVASIHRSLKSATYRRRLISICAVLLHSWQISQALSGVGKFPRPAFTPRSSAQLLPLRRASPTPHYRRRIHRPEPSPMVQTSPSRAAVSLFRGTQNMQAFLNLLKLAMCLSGGLVARASAIHANAV